MAIDLGTHATFSPDGTSVLRVDSTVTDEEVSLGLERPTADHRPGSLSALVGGLTAGLAPGDRHGGTLSVSGSLPLGAGLSSSGSLLVACAMALGISEPELDLALRCQAAEARGGQAVGLLDPLTILVARQGYGVALDFSSITWALRAIPEGISIVVIHSGAPRMLATSGYADRRAECARATASIGPLGSATLAESTEIADPKIRRRARHVITESERVDAFVKALGRGALHAAGALMNESHRSLSDDYEVSTPAIDDLVRELQGSDGVYGARMTGGGFGGCVVALTEPGSLDLRAWGRAWTVRPSQGAHLTSAESAHS